MKTELFTGRSEILGREMTVKVYGSGGKPVLVVPSQNGRYFDFENFGMVETCKEYIEAGKIQLFCIDTIDTETWSDEAGDPGARLQKHEIWFRYVIEEVYPWMMKENGSRGKAMVTGCSMGAFHAGNFFFRRPDLFDTLIALSGVYDPTRLIHGYFDETMYLNSPVHSLRGMPEDHPYMALYRASKIIICVGQGAWEDLMLTGTREIEQVLEEKGIPAWIDYWGFDVSHDWPWWRKQWSYFLGKVIG